MINRLLLIAQKYPSLISFIQYGIVGVLGTTVHTIVLALCVELLSIVPVISTIIGFVCSLVISYIINATWTFKGNNSNVKESFIKYALTCTFGLLINLIIMYTVVNMAGKSYLIGQLIAVIVVPIFNFTISRFWVFKSSN